MNSADFFLLYLHLANHKTINNCTGYEKETNNYNDFLPGKHITKGFRENLKPEASAHFLEQASTKKAFCLLAFAGLRKTLTVTEWRNPFGLSFYNQVLSNDNFAQIMGKLKTLTHLKNSITDNGSYPHTGTLSLDKPTTAAPGRVTTYAAGASPSSHLAKSRNKSVLDINPFTLSSLYDGGNQRLREPALAISAKLRNKLNALILSQSFKKNYITHLKYCDDKSFSGVNTQKQYMPEPSTGFEGFDFIEGQQARQPGFGKKSEAQGRKDHGMSLTSWASMSYFSGQSASMNREGQSTHSSAFIPNPRSKVRLLATKHGIDQPSNLNWSKNSVKSIFDATKQNCLLADPSLTRFYTASWLLESIRAELLLRNSNIKRVLNQVFLLAQQSLYNTDRKFALSLPGLQNKSPTGSGVLTSLTTSFHTPIMAEKEIAAPFGLLQSTFVENARPDETVQKAAIRKATVIPFLIKGLRVTLSGRMGGRKGMAKTLTKTAGRVPSSTLEEKVDFARGVVQTKTGSLGIKVWICYN